MDPVQVLAELFAEFSEPSPIFTNSLRGGFQCTSARGNQAFLGLKVDQKLGIAQLCLWDDIMHVGDLSRARLFGENLPYRHRDEQRTLAPFPRWAIKPGVSMNSPHLGLILAIMARGLELMGQSLEDQPVLVAIGQG